MLHMMLKSAKFKSFLNLVKVLPGHGIYINVFNWILEKKWNNTIILIWS